ncbi:hypothetical protein ACFL2R_00790 [Patescibacteria group bacterium]
MAESIVLDQPDAFDVDTPPMAEEGITETIGKESEQSDIAKSKTISTVGDAIVPGAGAENLPDMERSDFGINNALLSANKLGISAAEYSRVNGMTISRLMEEYPEMTSEQRESFDFGRPTDIVRAGSAEQKVADFIRESYAGGLEFDSLQTVDELLRENEFSTLFAGESTPEGSMGLYQEELVRFETGELRSEIFGSVDTWRSVVDGSAKAAPYSGLMGALASEVNLDVESGERMGKWTYRLAQAAVEQGKMEDLMRIIKENK